MARRFRGSFGGRSSAPKRQIGNLAITGEVDGGTTVVGTAKFVGTFGIASGTSPVTLVRTRGIVSARLSAFAGSPSIMRLVFGLIVINSDAAAVGVTAIPGPLTDSENDWIVWTPLTLLTAGAAEAGVDHFDRQLIDSRGMRKLKFGDVITAVIEVESDVAGNTVDIGYAFREQFKG